MESDLFKSDFMTQDLQPLTGSKLNFGQDSYSGYSGMNQDFNEKKRAGQFISALLDRQKDAKSDDPFKLIKELTTTYSIADKNSAERQSYHAYAKNNVIKNSASQGPSLDINNHSGFRTFGDLGGDQGTTNATSLGSGKYQEIFQNAQNKPKQVDWFQKLQADKGHMLQSNGFQTGSKEKMERKKDPYKPPKMKMHLTKEDEIQIGLDMIPMFKAKEHDLTQEYDKLKEINAQLRQLGEEQGFKPRPKVQPLITTSFMNRKPSQAQKQIAEMKARKIEQDPRSDSAKKEGSINKRPYEKNTINNSTSLKSAASFTQKPNSVKRIDSGIDKNISKPKVKRNAPLNQIDEQGESKCNIEVIKQATTTKTDQSKRPFTTDKNDTELSEIIRKSDISKRQQSERESSIIRKRLATAGVRSSTLNSIESAKKVIEKEMQVEKNLSKAYSVKRDKLKEFKKPIQSPKFVDMKNRSYCNGQNETQQTFGSKNSMALPKTNNQEALNSVERVSRVDNNYSMNQENQAAKRGLTGNPVNRIKHTVISDTKQLQKPWINNAGSVEKLPDKIDSMREDFKELHRKSSQKVMPRDTQLGTEVDNSVSLTESAKKKLEMAEAKRFSLRNAKHSTGRNVKKLEQSNTQVGNSSLLEDPKNFVNRQTFSNSIGERNEDESERKKSRKRKQRQTQESLKKDPIKQPLKSIRNKQNQNQNYDSRQNPLVSPRASFDDFTRTELSSIGDPKLPTSSADYSKEAIASAGLPGAAYGINPNSYISPNSSLYINKANTADRKFRDSSQTNLQSADLNQVVSGNTMLKIPRDTDGNGSRLTKHDVTKLQQNSSKCNSKATLLLQKLHKLEKKIAQRMKRNEDDLLNKDPNRFIVKEQGKSLAKRHKKELKRAHQMYVKDPLSVAQIPVAVNFSQTQTHKNTKVPRNYSSNNNAIIHFPMESQRTNLTHPPITIGVPGHYNTVNNSGQNTMTGNMPIRQTFTANGNARIRLDISSSHNSRGTQYSNVSRYSRRNRTNVQKLVSQGCPRPDYMKSDSVSPSIRTNTRKESLGTSSFDEFNQAFNMTSTTLARKNQAVNRKPKNKSTVRKIQEESPERELDNRRGKDQAQLVSSQHNPTSSDKLVQAHSMIKKGNELRKQTDAIRRSGEDALRKSTELIKRVDCASSSQNSNGSQTQNNNKMSSLRVLQRRSTTGAPEQRQKQHDSKRQNLHTQGNVAFTTAEFPEDGEVTVGSLKKHKKSLPSHGKNVGLPNILTSNQQLQAEGAPLTRKQIESNFDTVKHAEFITLGLSPKAKKMKMEQDEKRLGSRKTSNSNIPEHPPLIKTSESPNRIYQSLQHDYDNDEH